MRDGASSPVTSGKFSRWEAIFRKMALAKPPARAPPAFLARFTDSFTAALTGIFWRNTS